MPGFFLRLQCGGSCLNDYDAGVVEPPGVVEPEPGVVPGVGAGAAGGVLLGAGVVVAGAGLVAGAAASSFLLQALSETASTEAIIKVLLIIIWTPVDDDS